MDDESAFLAAIAAHPAEDTPRLAYADWLDEHDRPIRAEFIRVQCAVKQLEERPAEEQRPHIHLFKRQAHLLEQRRELLGPLGGDLGYFDVVFDRGFVAKLTLDVRVFINHAPAVAALVPRPIVRVTNAGAALDELLTRPELTAVSILSVASTEHDAFELGEGAAVSLALCPHLGRVEVLELEGCGIADFGLNFLAQAKTLPALIELDLSGNEITDEGVRSLVNSPLWPRLERLVLGGNPLSDVSAELLVEAAGFSKLQYLNLRFTGISPDCYGPLLHRYGGRLELF